MPKDIVVIGPPGTGKTRSMILTSTGWFKRGASPDQVAYLAFTRAAANEAASRILDEDIDLGLGPDGKLPYFRTLHSLAYRGMMATRKGEVRIITPADMKAFSAWSGYEGAYALTNVEDLSEVYQNLTQTSRTDYDKLLTAYALSRISARSPEELDAARVRMSRTAARTVGYIDQGEEAYKTFVQKYETFKSNHGLVDFTDMLAYALTEMSPLDGVRYVVIDEAQDLAPILFAIVDRLFASAEQIWWAGDPNQTIYGFAAADAKLFIGRFERADARVALRQLHRFGQDVVDFSTRIIRRARDKVIVDVIGKPGVRHKITRTGEFSPTVEPMLILHRHVVGCQALAAAYMAEGKPFRCERGKDPLGHEARIRAFKAMDGLAGGSAVSAGAVIRLVDDFMRSVLPPDASTEGKPVRLVVHGAKRRLQDGVLKGDVTLRDLVEAKILTEKGAEAVMARNLQVLKGEYVSDFEYYRKVVDRGYKLETVDAEGKPKVPIITTIHGSKGRQAPRVVVFDEMGPKCKEDMDAEHRLAYVAATRTEGDLEICGERKVDWAEEAYDYPLSGPPPKSVSTQAVVDPEPEDFVL